MGLRRFPLSQMIPVPHVLFRGSREGPNKPHFSNLAKEMSNDQRYTNPPHAFSSFEIA